MLGVTPDGIISVVSDVYGGKASDTFIFEKSGVINRCEDGDAVMVDKGFRIEKLCAKKSVQLIQPPFKWTDQLTPAQCEMNIAQLLEHVSISNALMNK
jgi:hypothetical protein